ncbi:MAG TPA: hypothetical protein VJZ32_03450 [Candidatus Bathyarchaeia archaeon]|nr:hypothetical protein [Candidatus Bathyarchaeia archaeon]
MNARKSLRLTATLLSMVGAIAAVYSLAVRPARHMFNAAATQYPQYSQYTSGRSSFGMFGILSYVIDFSVIVTALILAYMAITKPKARE